MSLLTAGAATPPSGRDIEKRLKDGDHTQKAVRAALKLGVENGQLSRSEGPNGGTLTALSRPRPQPQPQRSRSRLIGIGSGVRSPNPAKMREDHDGEVAGDRVKDGRKEGDRVESESGARGERTASGNGPGITGPR